VGESARRISRQPGNPSFSDTPLTDSSALKAAVGHFSYTSDGIDTVHVVCGISGAFAFGSDDTHQLARLMGTFYGSVVSERPISIAMTLKLGDLSKSQAGDASEDLHTLADLSPPPLRLQHLTIDNRHGGRINHATWKSMCLDSLRILFPCVTYQPMGRTGRPTLRCLEMPPEDAITMVQSVSRD
jgi:hypothetical protein